MSEVKLLWATPDLEHSIAKAARVSNPSNQENRKTESKLIKYLVDNKHWSPLEMANIEMEITTTRDIAHQLIRHRSFSFQEYSQRYSEHPGFVSPFEVRLQDASNRQNSIETDDPYLAQWWKDAQNRIIAESEFLYDEGIKKGIAKELMRKILPEGLTSSTIIVNGSVRSWYHYCEVRCHPSTQKEHREVAMKCRKIIADLFPSLEIENA